MDVILKRRLVGAAVIGLVAIVVVPMFLDGPDWQEQSEKPTATTTRNAEGERVVSVPLYGNAPVDEPRAPRPDSGSNGSSAPRVVASDSRAADRAQADRERRAAEQTERRREETRRRAEANRIAEQQRLAAERRRAAAEQQANNETTRPAPVAARSGWAVQLGTFSNQDNANRLLKKLDGADWPAWIAPVTNRSGKTFYRVRVGPEETRSEADKSAIRLAKQYSLQPRVIDLR